jgi:regulator of sigma E protease
MDILNQIFYFIVIIGVLVFVHELGHFLAAKLFKMRVERFSIGFPPRAFGRQIGETDYCVSWLPIGGYVKISGMIDESLDTEHLAKDPEPWEFRAKPVWQRVIVISAGVIMNVLLAIAIFWGLNMTRGKDYHRVTTVGSVVEKSLAAEGGIQPGDRIVRMDGEDVTYWEDIDRILAYKYLTEDITFEIDRAGTPVSLTFTKKQLASLSSKRFGAWPEGVSAVIGALEPGMPAAEAGLKPGDRFVSIDSVTVRSTEDVIAIVSKRPNTPITVSITRENTPADILVTPNEDGKIGIVLVNNIPGAVESIRYGAIEALGIGVRDFANITVLTVTNIWQVVTGQASFRKSIGGPVKIAEMAAQQAEVGIASFLGLMAILSISLAIINILPFPALDGGHLLFLIYEAIFRREVPNKLRMGLQQAGMVLLLAFMVFVLYNDIFH